MCGSPKIIGIEGQSLFNLALESREVPENPENQENLIIILVDTMGLVGNLNVQGLRLTICLTFSIISSFCRVFGRIFYN
jgi:hypothetical protein